MRDGVHDSYLWCLHSLGSVLFHFIYTIAFLSVFWTQDRKTAFKYLAVNGCVRERDAEAGITWHRETFPNNSMLLSSHLGIPLSKASQHNYNRDLKIPLTLKCSCQTHLSHLPTLSSSPSSQNDLTFTPLFRTTTILSASPSMFLQLCGYDLAISRYWTHASAQSPMEAICLSN